MRTLLSSIFFLISFIGQGQTISNTFQDEAWALKVKQLDDFVDRFNNEINYVYNGSIVKNTLPEEKRSEVLFSLFTKTVDSDKNQIDEFVNFVKGSGFYIKFGVSDIVSILTVSSTYKKESFLVDLFLKIELLPDGSSKWVIYDSFSSNYPWKVMEDNPEKFINPSNHNLRFSSIGKFVNEGSDIKGIFPDNFKEDMFSILVHELVQGNLMIGEIKNVRYSIKVLNKYNVVIDYVDSADKNSGWLISELIPIKSDE